MVDVCILGHSHIISVLDAITDWRTKHEREIVTQSDTFNLNCNVTNFAFGINIHQKWHLSSTFKIIENIKIKNKNNFEYVINNVFLKIIKGWSGDIPIVSMLFGNEHAYAMINSLPEYDFLDEEIHSYFNGVQIVDTTYIDLHIEKWVSAIYHPLRIIRGLVPNPLIHILCPPPRESPELADDLEILIDLVRRYGFVSDSLRLKLYRRYCRKLTSALTSINCIVLTQPADAFNIDGLLKLEYAEGLTHANKYYGELLLRDLEMLIKG